MPEALSKGLRNVVLDETRSSFIDGEAGVLLYRGYSIHNLAARASFEEVAYLLLHGSLPRRDELAAFEARLKRARVLPPEAVEVIRLTSRSHPMDVLRTAVSALAAFDPDASDESTAAVLRKSERLTAQGPAGVAPPHPPRPGPAPPPPRG